MRLDKYISQELKCGSKKARLLIALGKVWVNGGEERDNLREVRFVDEVVCDGRKVSGARAVYLMLNKPKGVVSATVDNEHKTVVDLIDEPYSNELHLTGRLDKESTGLMLLTNDGVWSKALTDPVQKVAKKYIVSTESVIDNAAIQRFAKGFYFAYEDITTLPAELVLIDQYTAEVSIYEGKYHQIKRMFHAIGNRVMSLHRLSIGCIALDPELEEAGYRELTEEEVREAKNLCSD